MKAALAWTSDVPRTILRIAALCALISLVSLCCAYFLAPGEAWTFEYRDWNHRPVPGWMTARSLFGPTIVYVEWSHTLVLGILSVFLLGFAYRVDFVRTVHALFLGKFNARKYAGLRITVLLCALVVLFVLGQHHLHSGPAELKQLYEGRHGHSVPPEQAFATYHLPYLLYFPFSFVNFFFGMLPIFAVCLLAVLRDTTAGFADVIRVFDREGRDGAPELVLDNFKRYYERTARRCGRYSSLALGIAAYALYEKGIGVHSTTHSAELMTNLGIQVVAAYGVSIVIVMGLYIAAYERVQTRLQRMGGDARVFARDHNVVAFAKDLWNRYARLYVGLGIMCNVIYPWIPNLVGFVKTRVLGLS